MVASLHHPHIVQVYNYGEHEGLPYIAMELVEGGSLADRLDGAPWPPRSRGRAVGQAGRSHAIRPRAPRHSSRSQAGERVDRLGRDRNSKSRLPISDWQKSSSTNRSLHTGSVRVSWHAKLHGAGASERSDPRHRAGCRHLLAGRDSVRIIDGPAARFAASRPSKRLRLLLSTEPVSIASATPRESPRDLATICDKCLQGEVDRRYASAAELRDDLERYLEGKPIQARRIAVSSSARGGGAVAIRLLAAALGSVATLLVERRCRVALVFRTTRHELAKTQLAEESERAAKQSGAAVDCGTLT